MSDSIQPESTLVAHNLGATYTPSYLRNARAKVQALIGSVREGIRDDEAALRVGFASYGAALSWLSEFKALGALQEARTSRAEVLAMEALDIADTDDSPQAKQRVSVRQWLAKCYGPETYGDKVSVDVGAQEVVHTHFVSLIGRREKVAQPNDGLPAGSAGVLRAPTGARVDAPLPDSTQDSTPPPQALSADLSAGSGSPVDTGGSVGVGAAGVPSEADSTDLSGVSGTPTVSGGSGGVRDVEFDEPVSGGSFDFLDPGPCPNPRNPKGGKPKEWRPLMRNVIPGKGRLELSGEYKAKLRKMDNARQKQVMAQWREMGTAPDEEVLTPDEIKVILERRGKR